MNYFKLKISLLTSITLFACHSETPVENKSEPNLESETYQELQKNTDFNITVSDSCKYQVDILYDFNEALDTANYELIEEYEQEGKYQYLPRNIPEEYIAFETILPTELKPFQDGIKVSLFPQLQFEFMNGGLIIEGDTVKLLDKFDNSYGSFSSSFVSEEISTNSEVRMYSDLGYLEIIINLNADECDPNMIESVKLFLDGYGEVSINNIKHFELFFIDSNKDTYDEIYIFTYQCTKIIDQIFRIALDK